MQKLVRTGHDSRLPKNCAYYHSNSYTRHQNDAKEFCQVKAFSTPITYPRHTFNILPPFQNKCNICIVFTIHSLNFN